MPAAKKTATPARAPRKAAGGRAPRTAPAVDTTGLTDGDREWVDQQTALASARTAAELEVLLEDIPDGAVAVPLGERGDIVHILPRGSWRSSTSSALQMGDFEEWASRALAPGEYDKVWLPLDPTLDEINDMFQAWAALTGQDMGKSPLTPTSLRRMSRR